MLQLEVVTNIYGNKLSRLRKSPKDGKQLLIKEGFKECINPAYFKKENTYVHYDKISRCWIFEDITNPDAVYSMEFDWLKKYGKVIAVYSLESELKTV